MRFSIIISSIILVTTAYSSANGQCRGFTKRNCFPLLEDYVHNGRYSSGKLAQGEKAEVKITFSSEHKYRLLVNGHEALGKVQFKVYNQSKSQLIYDNADNDYKPTWDFNLTNTQPLVIEINVPKSQNTHDLKHSGCVTVMIGYKSKE